MVSGFLVSFLGSTLILGGNIGLVGLGVLPVVWVAVYTTLTTIEDILSPAASQILSRYDPGRLLVVTEAVDVVLSVITLVLLVIPGTPQVAILIGYLVATSLLPLMLDLAEEFYAEQVAKQDPKSALSFNAALSSLSAGVSLLVAKPLGSYISGYSIVLLLALNAAFSLVAVFARRHATAIFPTSAPKSFDKSQSNDVSKSAPQHRLTTFIGNVKLFWRLGAVSPLTSAALALTTGTYGVYLSLYFSRSTPDHNTNLAICLGGVGLGAVLGPQLARLMKRWRSTVASIAALSTLQVGLLLVVAWMGAVGMQGVSALACGTILLVILGVCSSANLTLVRTERQVRLNGSKFAFAVGWSHSFSAAGLLVGTWTGLALDVAKQPVWGALISAIIAATLAIFCALAILRKSATGPSLRL